MAASEDYKGIAIASPKAQLSHSPASHRLASLLIASLIERQNTLGLPSLKLDPLTPTKPAFWLPPLPVAVVAVPSEPE
jgi:hypothetical protein